MPRADPRWRWGLLASVPVLALLLAGLSNEMIFELAGVGTQQPVFSDTVAILAAGEAQQAGRDIYASNPLDPFNRPHVYGALWLLTGDLGLVRADAWWLGVSLALIFIVVAIAVLAPRGPIAALVTTLLLTSPGVVLAMERGNNDLVIFLILIGASWLSVRASRWAPIAAIGLLALAMALKIYPAIALPSLAARAGSRHRAMQWCLAGILVCMLVLIWTWADIERVVRLAPIPLTLHAYGLKLGYYIILAIPDQRFWILLGIIPAVVFSAWFFWRQRGALANAIPLSGFTAACAVAGALAWSFCYVSTINFPYRLILLLLPARLWLEQATDAREGLLARAQLTGCVLLMWLTWWKGAYLVADGGRLIDEQTSFWIIVGLEHALALIITVGLCLQVLGWGLRRFVREQPYAA